MPELLLELGCEELPATFVRKAFTQLADEIQTRLEAAGIDFGERTELGSPRRLIVCFDNVVAQQPDQERTQRGPSIRAAFDADDSPTPALVGFCKSQGVDPSELTREGEYVWAKKTLPGRPTSEVAAELLPDAIRALTFDKSMRWGSGKMRFARPVRWILATFAGIRVDFEVEGVPSGTTSRGHRFEFPEPFEASSLESLLSGLRKRMVEPDPKLREELIRTQAAQICSGRPLLSDSLVDENVFLTEWPTALEGSFDPVFLSLPRPVLVTAMAKHEKFFPVEGPDGNLKEKFISIRNGGIEEAVREGNSWVLNARFNDAKFFFEQDQKQTLSDFLEATSRIVFQEKLGSVRLRADRLAGLSVEVAKETGGSVEEESLARQAGLYAKADLSTGLVSELPALQGVIGGEYARREGSSEAVCVGISSHYDLSVLEGGETAASRTGLRLSIADQLDKLAGYLGLGLVPSGSSDPYGLRRAATVLIEAALAFEQRISSLAPMFQCAFRGYAVQGIELDQAGATQALKALLCARYEALFEDVRYDILQAAVRGPETDACLDPRGVRLSIRALEQLVLDVAFVQTATRPLNIISAAASKNVAFDQKQPLSKLKPESLESEEGVALMNALLKSSQPLGIACLAEDVEGAAEVLKQLREPINSFFDSTMIMVEDEPVRFARLSLLQACCDQLLVAGDFSKIVQEGS